MSDLLERLDGYAAVIHPARAQLPLITTAKEAAARIRALQAALDDALEKMESDELKIEWEFGNCRSLDDMKKDGDLSAIILQARELLGK